MHKMLASKLRPEKARCVSTAFLASLFFTILTVIYSFDAQATPVVKLKVLQSYSLGSMVEYFEDHSGQLDIISVRTQPESAWQKSFMTKPSFGFSQSTYWFRIDFETDRAERRLLEVDYPLLDEITLFLFSEKQLLQKTETGDMKAFADRPLKSRKFVLPLNLPEDEKISLYLRVKSSGAVEVPLYLLNEAEFHEQNETELAILGLFFGVILAMVIYNLFIYLRLFEPAYIYYVLGVTTFGLFMCSMTGWGYKYLWPEAIHFQQYNIAIFIALSGIFASRFTHYFLDLPNKSPRIKLLLNGMVIVLIVLLLLLPFITYHIIVQATLVIIFITVLLAQYSGITLWRQGEVAARYFTIAWSIFLFSVLLATLEKFAVIPTTHWAGFIMPLGMALQVTLLSLAMGERINSEKQKRILAQEQVIQVQKTNQRSLENKVYERTMELEEAITKLHKLANTDSLTGIFNRRHFLEQATYAVAVAKRYQRPVAVIMLDIDFFKSVNDNYGHDIGDKVLKHVVNTIRKINRKTDIFGRLGGEEFGTLLVESASREAALNVAERIRLAVELSPLEYGDEEISVTVSQGVCITDPSDRYQTIDEMLKVADQALYHAKESGRNRVILLSADESSGGEG